MAANKNHLSSTDPIEKLMAIVRQLSIAETRETALIKLNEVRFSYPNFARLVWQNDITINAVMEEIIATYPSMSAGLLTVNQAHRLARTFSLVQSFAEHPQIRPQLLESYILIHIYPFLKTLYQSYQYEFLRLASLSVFTTLAESHDSAAISFLIVSGFIPIALVYMEYGSDLCRINSIQIVRQMLNDECCLQRICETHYLFKNIIDVLNKMVLSMTIRPITPLLRHIVKFYLRLTDREDARDALSVCLPENLRDQTFADCFKQDPVIERCLQKLTYVLWLMPEPGDD